MKSGRRDPLVLPTDDRHAMTGMQFSVPSKTFVLGEYAVLTGAPGLVLTTSPRFILTVKPVSGVDLLPIHRIHPESPAGRWIARHKELLRGYQLDFIDPHQGCGGFGASTAQFILIDALLQWIRREERAVPALLDAYLSLASSDGVGLLPSGVDLLAQRYGGLCYIDKATKTHTVFSWPFADIHYCLIHTGNKLATHHHLRMLSDLQTIPHELSQLVNTGRDALVQKNTTQFIQSVQDYGKVLAENKCLDARTQAMLDKINTCAGILAAKGCGAMGADVIFILYQSNKPEVVSWLNAEGFQVITHGNAVATGLEAEELMWE